MPARKRIGRPTEIPDRVELIVYLSRSEWQQIVRAARLADVSASAWVRTAALAALKDRTGRNDMNANSNGNSPAGIFQRGGV